MLTAKSEIYDKLNGLENGADDYITKPFHMRELIARIKVILKRNTNVSDINTLEFGDLKLNLRTGEMSCKENKITINGKELELLIRKRTKRKSKFACKNSNNIFCCHIRTIFNYNIFNF